MNISMTPIGYVHSTRKRLEDDHWDSIQSSIILDTKVYSTNSLQGLSDFSHALIIFHMNQVDLTKIETGARHPRGNPAWPKTGIFAQRGKDRPNQVGVTICRIERIEGTTLYLSGLDAIDGSPVLDIKPWINEFGPRGDVKQPEWVSELMKNYWA